MSGTSTSTPDDGGERRRGLQAEQRDGGRHRELEEVARADHRARGSDGVAHLQQLHGLVREPEDEDGLHDQRDGDQADVQRVGEDHLTLEGEQQHQGDDQPDRGHGRDPAHEDPVEPVDAARRISASRVNHPAANGITM
jgi:hypothetical protein